MFLLGWMIQRRKAPRLHPWIPWLFSFLLAVLLVRACT